jgi:peptidoglycan hydrolase-like protein with peptidoglycan-binding domain
MNHRQAREFATNGYKLTFGEAPKLPVIQCLQAVGALETSYGRGWKAPQAVNSNNVGAITAGGSWKGATFEHADTMPQDDGTNVRYVTKFRAYPTLQDGWADLAVIMYQRRPTVLAAALEGDAYGVSLAMYETKYYFGTGRDKKTRVERHYTALTRHLVAQCQALGEPLPIGIVPPPRTLKRGMIGEDVADLQRFLGITVDRQFGPETQRTVIEFQNKHGLLADGKVGERTWAVIEKIEDERKHDLDRVIAEMRAGIAAVSSQA